MVVLSVIIPSLNEEDRIQDAIQSIQRSCNDAQIIVVDGGSRDGTVAAAKNAGVRVILSRPGRAIQMNKGARYATADILVFCPADTSVPKGFKRCIQNAFEDPNLVGAGFRVRFDAPQLIFRLIECSSNFRARFLKIFYLDQVIVVRSSAFKNIGGFPDLRVMEETALCDCLKKIGILQCLDQTVVSSARRFLANGPVKTWLMMGAMRIMYRCGAGQESLIRFYGRLKKEAA